MFAGTRNHLDAVVLPLWNAVFCLDCEVISSGRGDECAACKSRSLVSLARMLEGSLLAHRAQRESGLFDITITIELQQMQPAARHRRDAGVRSAGRRQNRHRRIHGVALAGDRHHHGGKHHQPGAEAGFRRRTDHPADDRHRVPDHGVDEHRPPADFARRPDHLAEVFSSTAR